MSQVRNTDDTSTEPVAGNDLVERVRWAIEGDFDWTVDDGTIQIHFTNNSARAAIREVADWLEMEGFIASANLLRSQLEE